MKKYFLIWMLISFHAYTESSEVDFKEWSDNLFKMRQDLYFSPSREDTHGNPYTIDMLARTKRVLKIMNGDVYPLSKEKFADAEERIQALGILYQATLHNISREPEKDKLSSYEKKHRLALEIMKLGVSEIIRDFTLGARRGNLIKKLINAKDKFKDYGRGAEIYLNEDALKILFPKGFFKELGRLGCTRDRKEAYDFALAVKGKDYIIDEQHFFFPLYNKITEVHFQHEDKGAIQKTVERYISQGTELSQKTFYYKQF